MSKDKFQSLIDSFGQAFENTCCNCTNPIMDGEVKHKITDMDNYTRSICDSCWNKLKAMMDQEE